MVQRLYNDLMLYIYLIVVDTFSVGNVYEKITIINKTV